MSYRSISLTFATICVIVLAYTTTISGSDPQPVPPKANNAKPTPDKEATLKEISRIREQLGGSVLKGSILDGNNVHSPFDFDTGLRSELGLPAKSAKPKNPSAKLNRSKAEIIKSLRTHCSKLDEIANHIETLREYEYADSLRDSAADLRMIARQMDTR